MAVKIATASGFADEIGEPWDMTSETRLAIAEAVRARDALILEAACAAVCPYCAHDVERDDSWRVKKVPAAMRLIDRWDSDDPQAYPCDLEIYQVRQAIERVLQTKPRSR